MNLLYIEKIDEQLELLDKLIKNYEKLIENPEEEKADWINFGVKENCSFCLVNWKSSFGSEDWVDDTPVECGSCLLSLLSEDTSIVSEGCLNSSYMSFYPAISSDDYDNIKKFAKLRMDDLIQLKKDVIKVN